MNNYRMLVSDTVWQVILYFRDVNELGKAIQIIDAYIDGFKFEPEFLKNAKLEFEY